jgi:hypothetical protein
VLVNCVCVGLIYVALAVEMNLATRTDKFQGSAKGLRRATGRAYPVADIQFVDREINGRLKDTLPTEGLDHLSTAEKVGEDAVLRW